MLYNNKSRNAIRCIQNEVTQTLTNSFYIHAEIMFPGNQTVFMITPKTKTVTRIPSRDFKRDGYEFWKLPVSEKQYLCMWNYCNGLIGTRYDSANYMCMPFYLIVNILTCHAFESCITADSSKTNCSRMIIEAMRAAGFELANECNPSIATPAMIHLLIQREGAYLDNDPEYSELGTKNFTQENRIENREYGKVSIKIKKPYVITSEMYGERS